MINNHRNPSRTKKLYESTWFQDLQKARDTIIHRSVSPVMHDTHGAAFEQDLGLFEDGPPGFHVKEPRIKVEPDMSLLHLDRIMKGFVVELEKWEAEIAGKLRDLASFPSLNMDGILIGIEFNDDNLLRDGSGPSIVVQSRTK